METLASDLKLPPFDLLLVGDGAGSFAHTPCGWACVSYFRPSGKVAVHPGGHSGGTNQLAEIAPFLFTLQNFHTIRVKTGSPSPSKVVKVVIVSDSEVSVKCGNGEYQVNANQALWRGLQWFVSGNGYSLTWKWVSRNSNPVNAEADRLAKMLRKTGEALSGKGNHG